MTYKPEDWLRTVVFTLLLCITSTLFVSEARSQDLPSLSDEIKSRIDSDGIAAAKKFFDDVFPAKLDKYKIDNQAFGTVISDYMQAGDMNAGMAVSEMYASVVQATIEDMIPPEVSEMMADAEKESKARRQQREEETALAQETVARDKERRMGPTRDDLHRFVGLYGDPTNEDTTRRLWVSQSCEGRLVVGAMWGDASPWYLTSKGDSEFSVDTEWQKLKVSFENNSSGKAIGMIHSLDFLPSELQRVDNLPAEWQDCVQTGR